MMAVRFWAGLCVGTALSLGVLALTAAVFGAPDVAVYAVIGICLLLLGYRVARHEERLNALGAPRHRCDWCDQLTNDPPAVHATKCEARNPQEGS